MPVIRRGVGDVDAHEREPVATPYFLSCIVSACSEPRTVSAGGVYAGLSIVFGSTLLPLVEIEQFRRDDAMRQLAARLELADGVEGACSARRVRPRPRRSRRGAPLPRRRAPGLASVRDRQHDRADRARSRPARRRPGRDHASLGRGALPRPTRAEGGIRHPEPLSPDELAHPGLAPVAAVTARWLGRQSFHAGAFAIGTDVWALLADGRAERARRWRGWPRTGIRSSATTCSCSTATFRSRAPDSRSARRGGANGSGSATTGDGSGSVSAGGFSSTPYRPNCASGAGSSSTGETRSPWSPCGRRPPAAPRAASRPACAAGATRAPARAGGATWLGVPPAARLGPLRRGREPAARGARRLTPVGRARASRIAAACTCADRARRFPTALAAARRRRGVGSTPSPAQRATSSRLCSCQKAPSNDAFVRRERTSAGSTSPKIASIAATAAVESIGRGSVASADDEAGLRKGWTRTTFSAAARIGEASRADVQVAMARAVEDALRASRTAQLPRRSRALAPARRRRGRGATGRARASAGASRAGAGAAGRGRTRRRRASRGVGTTWPASTRRAWNHRDDPSSSSPPIPVRNEPPRARSKRGAWK